MILNKILKDFKRSAQTYTKGRPLASKSHKIYAKIYQNAERWKILYEILKDFKRSAQKEQFQRGGCWADTFFFPIVKMSYFSCEIFAGLHRILLPKERKNGQNKTFLFIILIEFNCFLGLFPSSI